MSQKQLIIKKYLAQGRKSAEDYLFKYMITEEIMTDISTQISTLSKLEYWYSNSEPYTEGSNMGVDKNKYESAEDWWNQKDNIIFDREFTELTDEEYSMLIDIPEPD